MNRRNVMAAAAGLGLVPVLGAAQPAAKTELAGDGTTDNTDAIQKAIDAGQGGIHFAKGVYRITRPIVINLGKVGYTAITADGTATLLMAGAGPALKFVGTHGGSAAPRTFKPNVWEHQRSPRVDGLEIVGTHAEADGIAATGTMQLILHAVTIRKCRHGVRLYKRNRNVILSACHIYENTGIGVFYDDVDLHQSNIIGCHISYCDGGGVVFRGGAVRNVHIGTCDIEANQSKDGPPTANVLIDCTGGSTAEVAITGCTIQHANVPDSANIRVLGAGQGLREKTANWGHITIGDNVFSDVAVNVDLKDCRGVTVTGNTFWMGHQFNLRVENSQQVVVGPNAFERNPAYDYGVHAGALNSLLFKDCRDCTLTGLHVQGARGPEAALTLDNCSRSNVTGCTVLDCDGVAVLLKNPKHSRLSDCLVRHDGEKQADAVSLRVIGGEGNQITDNLLGNKVDGVK